MEGQNILYGGIEDLKNVQAALDKQAALRNQIASASSRRQGLTKDIEAEEKLLRESVEATVKKRREQVASNFDREISKAQDRLKQIRSDRTKAKNKGIEARIKEETEDIVQENKKLKDEIRTIFKKKGVYKWLDSKPVYILYYPKTAAEKCIFLAVAFMALIAVPAFVVAVTSGGWLLHLLEYILIAAIFAVLYAVGYKYVRLKNQSAFEETKVQHITMLKNQAKIKRIIKSVKKDKDDERYGLHEFDDEIKELEGHIGDIVESKNNALADFDKTTKADIEEEITERSRDKIERLKKELSENVAMLKVFEEQQKNITIDISTNYTAYIGEENMRVDRLEKMVLLLADGRAKTIGAAIDILEKMQ